jgi:hypothetical protein
VPAAPQINPNLFRVFSQRISLYLSLLNPMVNNAFFLLEVDNRISYIREALGVATILTIKTAATINNVYPYSIMYTVIASGETNNE